MTVMHQWEIIGTIDEESLLDDHIEDIIASEETGLPPREQSIGETAVRWDRVGEDQAFIQAQGGTIDDRVFARAMVASQLEGLGIKEAEYSFDDLTNLYHAAPTVDRERVRTHGLIPSRPANNPHWNDWDSGWQPKWLRNQPEGVYMATNPVDVPMGDQRDVWRVDPSYIRDPQQDSQWDAWVSPHAIPPEALTLHRPYEQSPMGEDAWPQREFSPGGPHESRRRTSVEKTSEWNDVMDKARRLIQQGRVRILRNGYNNIVAWVKGDHGEYNPEIFRQDPNSRSITGSDCACGWGEYQNQPRTRQWKKYQDRPCWLPGSLVSMADGTRVPIEMVRPGDRVLSAHGPRTISHHHTNHYDGQMQTIRWQGSTFGTTVTHDHKMITHPQAAEVWRTTKDNGNRARQTSKMLQNDGWVQTLAHEVKPDDWLKLSYPTEVRSLSLDVALVCKLPIVDGRCRARNHCYSMPARISSEEEVRALLTLAGYYLAEGSIESRGKVVSWTFHCDEIQYADALANALVVLGAGPLKRYLNDNRITLRSSNVALARTLYYLCGDGARSKQLASELMLLPAYDQRFFLERYAEGDGTGGDWSSAFVINTASEALARQLVSLGSRLYQAIPTVSWFKNSGGPTRRDADDLMIARIKFNQKYNCGVVRLQDGYYAARIVSITSAPYSGTVYNLTVPPEHTVTVDGVCSYQCSHILAAYWQALGTPLDEDLAMQQGQDPQQQLFQGTPGGTGANPSQGLMQPSQALQGAPAPPQGQQMGIPGMEGPSPADVLPQFQTEPPDVQPLNPASVPGLKGPTPTNPLTYPPGPGGTFSSWREADAPTSEVPAEDPRLTAPLTNGQMVQLRYPDEGNLQGRFENWTEPGAGGDPRRTQLPAGLVGEVLGTDPATGFVSVLYTGKPWEQNTIMQPFGATGEHLRSWLIHRPDVKPPGPAIRRRR